MNERIRYADLMMKEYKFFGEKYSVHFLANKPHTKLYDISDDDIKIELKELKRMNHHNESMNNCWITILNDVLYKRRFNKIDKLINNIK